MRYLYKKSLSIWKDVIPTKHFQNSCHPEHLSFRILTLPLSLASNARAKLGFQRRPKSELCKTMIRFFKGFFGLFDIYKFQRRLQITLLKLICPKLQFEDEILDLKLYLIWAWITLWQTSRVHFNRLS